MRNKPGPDRSRVGGSVPHPSWNLDRPIIFAPADAATPDDRAAERRRVTPEEIWAVVDAVN